MTVVELLDAIAAGAASPVDLVDAALSRLAEADPAMSSH